MPTTKPRIFIASSVEGLGIAHAIQENLQHSATCKVWSQGVFLPSSYPLESLDEEFKKSDFGIFVFSPDDAIRIRDKSKKTVRDNILIELGMSLGQLGRRRSFIVAPRDIPNLHIPTDLMGLNPVTFEANGGHDNLLAALGPACSQIRNAVQQLGCRNETPETVEKDDPTRERRTFQLPGHNKVQIRSGNALYLRKKEPQPRTHPLTFEELPKEARVILLSCTVDHPGEVVLKQGDEDGNLEIHTDNGIFNAKDAEAKTKWFEALRVLQSYSLIRQKDLRKYELTEDGELAGNELRFEKFENPEELCQLGRPARRILIATVTDEDSQIMLIEELSGFDIMVGNKSCCPEGFGPRKAYKNGLFELDRLALIRKHSASEGNVVYDVTDRGNAVADALADDDYR